MIKLSKEQTKAWDYLSEDNQKTQRVIYGGQAGGGKSFLISIWQIDRRMRYPGTRGYIAREVLKDLKNSILITFFDVARSMGVEYHYNDQKSYIDFPNGSRIVLLEVKYKPSDPDFQDLGSTEYTDGAVEEGITIHSRAADLLLSRTRYKHDVYGLTPKQLITCNPGPGWIKDKVVIPHFEGIIKAKNKFVRATLDSNPNKDFVKGYKATLEGLDNPYDKARLLHGDWYAMPQTGGESYKEFDQVRHVSDNIGYTPHLPLHLSFDENVNPYITLTVWQIDGKQITQIDEFCLKHPNNTLKKLCSEFAQRYRHHVAGLYVYGDATSKKQDTKLEKGYNFFTLVRQYLETFKPTLRVPPKNPPVVMRINFINEIFRSNFDGLTILISNICTHSIEDLNQVKEDADGTKKKEKVKDPETGVSYERHGHCFTGDTLIMTEQGQIPIKDVKEGMRVWTRAGLKTVVFSGMTNPSARVNTYQIAGKKITCTPGHKIWTAQGFQEVASLTGTNTFCIFGECEKPKRIADINSTDTQTPVNYQISDITKVGLGIMEKGLKQLYIDSRGYVKRDQYQRASTYTIATGTTAITQSKTSNVSAQKNTIGTITRKKRTQKSNILKMFWPKRHSQKQQNGTSQRPAGRGMRNTLKTLYTKTKGLLSAWSAERKRKRQAHALNFVQGVVKVEPTQEFTAPVYDLTVKGQHEFFANGVLVHNCSDTMDYFITEAFKNSFTLYVKGPETTGRVVQPIRRKTRY